MRVSRLVGLMAVLGGLFPAGAAGCSFQGWYWLGGVGVSWVTGELKHRDPTDFLAALSKLPSAELEAAEKGMLASGRQAFDAVWLGVGKLCKAYEEALKDGPKKVGDVCSGIGVALQVLAEVAPGFCEALLTRLGAAVRAGVAGVRGAEDVVADLNVGGKDACVEILRAIWGGKGGDFKVGEMALHEIVESFTEDGDEKLTEGLVALRDWIGGGLVALDDDKGVLGELETAVLDDLRNGVVGGTLSEKVAALDGAKKGLLAAAVPVFESEVVAPLLAYCKGGGVQVVGGSLGKQGQDPSRQDAFRNASGFDAWDPANSGRLAEWFVEDGSIPKVGGTAKSSRGGVGVILGGGYGHRVCDAVRLGFGLRGLYSSAQARVLCPGSSKVSDGAYSLKCPLALSFGPELSFALCPGVVVHFLGGAQIGFCRLGSRNPGELYAAKARATLPIAGVSVNGRDLAGAEATKFYGKSGTTKKTGFGAYCEGGVNIAVYPGVWVGLCVGYGFGLKGPVTPGVASSRLSSLVISTTVRGYF